MCNLYSITKNQDAIRRLFKVARDTTGNLPNPNVLEMRASLAAQRANFSLSFLAGAEGAFGHARRMPSSLRLKNVFSDRRTDRTASP